MKRFVSAFLTVLLLFSLAGCGGTESAETPSEPLRIGALKGPTGMGLAPLMDDESYAFTLAGSADELTPKLVKGELDLACVPANLAAVLYNNTDGAVQVAAVNTLGVLYIVANDASVQSVEDLAGRTIYAAGKGATPEYTLRYILSEYNIEATVEWKSEHAECVAALLQDENAVALLPQPFATSAVMQNENARIALDLNELWEDLGDRGALITGCIVVRRELAEQRGEALNAFLDAYAASVSWVNENASDAAALMEQHGIIKAAVAEQALPYCHIVCIRGEEMKAQLAGYLSVLAAQNSKAVGGKLPDEDFYYFK